MSNQIDKILRIRDEGLKKSGKFDYGANVLPVLRHYSSIKDSDERKEFQNALEEMLVSEQEEIRKYGVTLCLGFFVFRDVV